MIVTIPKEPIDESLLPTLTFYHGSIHKLDKILPTAFDVGNKLRNARWSVFMFRKKEYAKYYAMSFMIEQTIKSLKRSQTEFPPTMQWLEKTGINSYEFRCVAMDKNYDEIKNLCLGKKYYVYTLEVPLSTSLDVIGTNPTLPEYTYGGTPKTVKRDEYTITEEDFDKLHKRVSKEEYDKIFKEKPFRKPIVSQAFRAFQLDDDTRSKNRRVAIILSRQGDLKPGDDLKFLKDSSIYYRVTYKGEGIYQAVKKAVSKKEWEELLKDPALTWLPKPPKYEEGYESYFTKDGFSKFFATARKIFRNILDDKYIKLSKAKIDNKDIVYKDKYQVVANKNNVVKEETDMLITESLQNGNNILFSEDDIYCNTEKWDSGEAHVVFIMGLSGSGKSTLAKKMKDKNKCQYVSTDTIAFSIVGEKKEKNQNWEYIENAEPLLAKFMRVKHLQPDFMRHIPSVTKENPVLSKKDEAKKQEWVDKYLHWLCFEQKEKVVIEGGHACVTLSKENEFRDLPIIFKGTSLAKSMMRRLKRDFESGTMSLAKLASRFNVFYTQYGKMLPEVNAARKAVITDDNYKYQHESTSIHSNEITSSKLPYKCEVKMCHQNYNNGNPRPSAKPTPQLILHKDGKNWRVRAEMLLFKEGKLYLVKQNKVNQYGVTYKLPGGGIDDPQEGIEETASRECKEEALIIPTNVVYTGVEVQHIYDKIPEWHKAILHPEGIYYDGSMTFICTGEYKKEYKSYVKKMDQQDEMTKGHFYTYEQVEGILSKEHKALFKKYLKDYRRIQFMKEEFIPEIDRSFLDMDISCLVEDKK